MNMHDEQTLERLRERLDDEDFCLFFRIDPAATEREKLAALRYYFHEWHSSDRFNDAVDAVGDIMLYRHMRVLVGVYRP
jgi:hypothetical protein